MEIQTADGALSAERSGEARHTPAGEVEQLVLVGHCGLLLQLPHQYADQMGVPDHDRHLLKHVLEPNVGLLQPGGG